MSIWRVNEEPPKDFLELLYNEEEVEDDTFFDDEDDEVESLPNSSIVAPSYSPITSPEREMLVEMDEQAPQPSTSRDRSRSPINTSSESDVSLGIKKLRDFLLGRKHNLHGRFPPLIAPRSIPPPDIPRGPEYKYSKQYYYERHALNSVKPPVVAPVAEGPPAIRDPTKKAGVGGMKPDSVCFTCLPTPGSPWWWDGHCYYEHVPDPCPPCPPQPPPCEPLPSQPFPPCPPAPDQKY